MNMKIKRGIKTAIICAALLGTTAAYAQQSACVHLMVGAGYAAWMRVVSGDYASEWSDSFPIGQTRCKSLEAIGDGQPFTVQISAVMGSSKVHCQPDNIKRVAAAPGSTTFLAWGTTLAVKCEMPSTDNAKALTSATKASSQGLKAAKKVKMEGANLKAPPK